VESETRRAQVRAEEGSGIGRLQRSHLAGADQVVTARRPGSQRLCPGLTPPPSSGGQPPVGLGEGVAVVGGDHDEGPVTHGAQCPEQAHVDGHGAAVTIQLQPQIGQGVATERLYPQGLDDIVGTAPPRHPLYPPPLVLEQSAESGLQLLP